MDCLCYIYYIYSILYTPYIYTHAFVYQIDGYRYMHIYRYTKIYIWIYVEIYIHTYIYKT